MLGRPYSHYISRNKFLFISLIIINIYCVIGCAFFQADQPSETVLIPNSKIRFSNKSGEMIVEYISPIKRKFIWNGNIKSLDMLPRNERWYGLKGIYSSEPWPWEQFIKQDGISRILAQEGTLNFNSIQEFLEWKNGEWNSIGIDYVYNNTGLMAGWCKTPGRDQMNIDIIQILIHGKKPEGLPGANDQAIEWRN